MMSYTPEQQRVIKKIIRIGRKRGEKRVKIKANLETGQVESGFRNLPGGDADSAGYRQERASLYADPTNLKAAINRFYNEADKLYHGQPAGQLAADVQRPRADLRGKYGDVGAQAKALLKGVATNGSRGSGGRSGGGTRVVKSSSTRQVPDTAANQQIRTQAALGYLSSGQHDPSALVDLASTIGQAHQTRPVTTTKIVKAAGGGTGDVEIDKHGTGLQKAVATAARIAHQHYNYEWGGGHNAGVTPTHGSGHGSGPGVGYDCSGAVSKVLGVNARVSGEFAKWGQAGEGGNVTVYASPTHVLMKLKVNGKWRFFGTSAQNHGGGAGWIPSSYFPAGYLDHMTARHATI